MKYSVDRIVENIAVLQNIETEEIVEVELKKLPKQIHEGSILVLNNDIYEEDIEEETSRRNKFRERLERLKKLNK